MSKEGSHVFLIGFEPENMPNLCDFGCIFEGKIRVPRPRKLSRENVFIGMKTTFFNNFSIISSKEDTFICHVPKFHDFWCTRSIVIADCLGRKIGDSPCNGAQQPYISILLLLANKLVLGKSNNNSKPTFVH